MTIRRSHKSLLQSNKNRKKRAQQLSRRKQRDLQVEKLEDRMLLALGPQLIAINPNDGDLLVDGQIRDVAPRDLTFRFDDGQVIDPSSLAGIQITRSGLDGVFGGGSNSDDVIITPGFIGVGDAENEVVVRFAQTLPDDVYRIEILGSGLTPLRNTNGTPFNDGDDLSLDFELDLGSQILSVVPQPIVRDPNTGELSQRRNEIVVYFNNDDLFIENDQNGPTNRSAEHPGFYQLIFTKETVANTDDVVFHPTSVDYNADTDTAILRFDQAASLDELVDPDTNLQVGGGTFRLRIGTEESLPLAPLSSSLLNDVGSSFNTALSVGLNLTVTGDGSAISDEQTFTISDNIGNIQVFELDNNGSLADGSAVRVSFNSGMTQSQVALSIVSAINFSGLDVQANANGDRIALNGATDVTLDPALTAISNDRLQSIIISSAIDPQAFDLAFPGANNEPGHREIPIQDHLLASADGQQGITTQFYNFRLDYGSVPNPNPNLPDLQLINLITETQKRRAREIFELYENSLGIRFVETQSLGFTIATGDLRAVSPTVPTGPGGVIGIAGGGLAVMDNAEIWDDNFGANWFQTAMHEIGHLLGLGHTHELPELTIQGDEFDLRFGNTPDPVFPGDHDIVHGQNLFRPESKDIDLFKFDLAETGQFSAETIAERLENSSLLDTTIRLYRESFSGQRELIASNDDYYSEDSFLELELTPGTYYLGVSASGNSDYDPSIEDSGIGGTSQGAYNLRLNFRPNADTSIVDSTFTAFDGDADGVSGGVFNFWFRAQDEANTIVVDKAAPSLGDGSFSAPYNNISNALLSAQPGQIVRIVGNGGLDGDLTTLDDNLAYEIGFNGLGQPLADGVTLDVPKDVVVMIDAGAILKLRRSRIGVGSSSSIVDRSGGALQVLGTPGFLTNGQTQFVLDADDVVAPGSVFFTSIFDNEIGLDTNPEVEPDPQPGNWGGISFRNDIDQADAQRINLENQGLFLNSVILADMRYGGGNVVVDSVAQTIAPIQMSNARPSIFNNTITLSAEAAISANPNSFEETNFHTPEFQKAAPFTADYTRVGPDISGNTLIDNSINGLFVRVRTPAGNALQKLTVSGRFDDTDITHVILENLQIEGTPGGPLLELDSPPVVLVALSPQTGGSLSAGDYNYHLVFVDAAGNEGPPSDVTATISIAGNPGEGSVELRNLPPAPTGFVARRLYRSDIDGQGPYTLVTELNASATTFVDDGSTQGGLLDFQPFGLRARLDARLAIDPGTIVKFNGSGIETTIGSQLIAEGTDGNEVVFTSLLDDRYGAGATFDTGNDADLNSPNRGDWAGLFIGHVSSASIDHAVIAFAGGVMKVEGNFTGFNPVEIHQATARVAHTLFEENADGQGGQAPSDRFGRGFNSPASIFVRGAQPVIIENVIRDNNGPAININANALNHVLTTDPGRTTGLIDQMPGFGDNQGPLVRGNLLDQNGLNGMFVRGATLTTQGVWDDTDIVHVLTETVFSPDFHTFGGLRLESSQTESLVVKLQGDDAGFTAMGRPLDIDDRIGGAIQIIGQPGFPVVLTSLVDDTVGAGFRPDGSPQVDTNSDGFDDVEVQLPTGPEVDNGTLIDNDVQPSIPGQFAFKALDGGNSGFAATFDNIGGDGGGISAQGDNKLFINDDVIFEFFNFVDVGSDGRGLNLGDTTITMPATLIAPDLVVSEGTFAGENDLVLWRVESRMDDGVGIVFNTITFSSSSPLGNLQFINYLDEDIELPNDDLLFLKGIPGQDDFRAFTLDGPERVGFSHGGFFESGPNLVNATFDGWAADKFRDLLGDIEGGGTAFTVNGNIDTADLIPFNDPDLGDIFGLADVTTAFAWSIDPDSNTATITTVLELVEQNPGAQTQSGDWRSVQFQQYSHDRNVEIITESEPRDIVAPGNNGTPNNAQFIGALAPNEKSGDDNLRLGFEVHGLINEPGDVDVFSFTADAGTEVWIDIDRTTHSLDTVIELIDANGLIIAQSDNSVAEGNDPSLLFAINPSIEVNGLQKSPFEPQDRWTTNPRDAGMRVVMPGPAGTTNTYHIRVRSSNLFTGDPASNLQDPSKIHDGLTSGAYQMQVRLREIDEFAGSTVRFADIRFATNGIEIFGQPLHSPLLGEASEDSTSNDTFATAQPLGNVLTSDRATLSLSGNISTPTDVDWYQFEVTFDSVQTAGFPDHASLIFDLDYADGFSRPDTLLSIFDANGNLVLSSRSSNIADDQLAPLANPGLNEEDLLRGSAGTQDGFIGPVELPVGTYFLAVSSTAVIPQELTQFATANPTNTLARLEPIDSIVRVAEDHIGSSVSSTASAPQIPVVFDADSTTPFNLSDVTLFVSRPEGTNGTIFSVDPFTGQRETTLGRIGRPVGDIVMRPDGNLFAYTLSFAGFRPNDATSGNFLNIDTGTGAGTTIVDDGIITYELDNNGNVVVAHNTPAGRVGYGIQFQALAFSSDTFGDIYAIGNRGDDPFAFGPDYSNNILYFVDGDEFDGVGPGLGRPFVDPNQARISGAGTDAIERGQIITDFDSNSSSQDAMLVVRATDVDAQGITTFLINDRDTIAVTSGGTTTVFELNSGPEVRLNFDLNNNEFVRDEDNFRLGVGLSQFDFEFNSGPTLVIPGVDNLTDGESLVITDNTGVSRTFELDSDGNVTPGRVAVPINSFTTPAQFINTLETAINTASFGVQATAVGGRISLTQDTALDVSNIADVFQDGDYGVSISGATAIPVEEFFTPAEVRQAIVDTFALSVPGITASAAGERVNFSGAEIGFFNPSYMVSTGSTGFVTGGRVAVDFLAEDTVSVIAQKIATQINTTLNPAVVATATPNTVQINGASGSASFAIPADPMDPPTPFQLGGQAPGGLVTGAAQINGQLYVVTDAGGLHLVTPFGAGFNRALPTDYIETSINLEGLSFSGLSKGPRTLEGGKFSEVLFGIDDSGDIHAFNTDGELQRIFAGNQSTISTGIFNPSGLAFSTLDRNLWHSTGRRRGDAGHGFDSPVTDSRIDSTIQGGSSFYFGNEDQTFAPGTRNPFGNETRFDFDFPGGAHGSMVSAPFSLEGYSPADAPVLYFNYFLDTEQTDYNPFTNPVTHVRDSFRVFVSSGTADPVTGGDVGDWHLLATNDSFRDPNRFDEFDLGPFAENQFNSATRRGVQELHDNTGWRQARIDLSPYAGRTDIQLRFDFSSAGSFDVGDSGSTGSEILAVSGAVLRDGETFVIDNEVFEVNLGFTLVAPTGAAITDGETFSIDGISYEFDLGDGVSGVNIPIPFNPQQTAADVASSIQQALLQSTTPQSTRIGDFLTGSLIGNETNDSLGTSVVTGIDGRYQRFTAAGEIGDNLTHLIQLSIDVDMVQMDLEAGQTVTIDVEAERIGSTLDAVLRVFNESGIEIVNEDNTIGLDPFVVFTAPSAGRYFVAVSNSVNDSYDPAIIGSGVVGSVGNYQLTINPVEVPGEGNDTLVEAFDTGLTGANGNFLLTGGVIGDNQNLGAMLGKDVDMFEVHLRAGSTINIDVDASEIGSPLDSRLRLFDANGNEVASDDDTNGFDPLLNFVVPVTGVYYIGVSSSTNAAYDPTVEGSGTAGNIGNYDLAINVSDISRVIPHLNFDRLNLEGGTAITQSAGAELVVEGAPDVTPGNRAVNVHAGMANTDVAGSIAVSVADTFDGGNVEVITVNEQRVRIVERTVLSSGPFGLNADLDGDATFGAFRDSFGTYPGSLRGIDNLHEGVFVDDIIIGFAERGELVTGSTGNTNFVNNPMQGQFDIQVGNYQLEIRRGEEHGLFQPVRPSLFLTEAFDTNYRFTQQQSIIAPAGHSVFDGQSFTIGDGIDQVTFEFEDLNIGDGVTPGNEPLTFNTSDTSIEIAREIRESINSPAIQAVLEITAAFSDGEVSGFTSTSSRVDLFGNAIVGIGASSGLSADLTAEGNDTIAEAVNSGLVSGGGGVFTASGFIGDNSNVFPASNDVDLIRMDLTAGAQATIDIDARDIGSSLDSVLRVFDDAGNQLAFNDDFNSLDSFIDFIAPFTGTFYVGVSSFANFFFDPNVEDSSTFIDGFSTGFYNITINIGGASGISTRVFDNFGDSNTFRDQGQLIIQSSRISNSLNFGIVADAGVRDGDGDLAHGGPVRVLRKENDSRLTPGVTITNNTVFGSGSGGILFSGDPNLAGQSVASVPFGRILNNTIYGNGAGDIGIQVTENASPTLLNNILANLGTGIDVDASSDTTVIGGTLFQGNGTDSTTGLGDFPIVLGVSDPLFVNGPQGNFYLSTGSFAIDSSVDSLSDRPELVNVKNPLGIADSPILAPNRDGLGQLRIDDPSVSTPPGQGENVFKDRGAIDRVDFAGPSAVLLDPRDNDSSGLDKNSAVTVVETSETLNQFSIQIVDGIEPVDPLDGTGVNDDSVTSDKVTITQNGVLLVEGLDYRFQYSRTNNVIRLTPLSGIWTPNANYVITLDNSVATGIKDNADNTLKANQNSGETQFTVFIGSGLDFGDAPDPTFATLSANNGASHKTVEGFSLGVLNDTDVDGQPTAAADGDGVDDDGVDIAGVLMVPGFDSTINVTVTAPALFTSLLDAWIDFNGDGDWNDPGEQIFFSESLNALPASNQLTFAVPSDAVTGQTYARFRLSTSGGLASEGPADDGEVEDYLVSVTGNPYQNSPNNLDVNNDGSVSPIDALLVINDLNFNPNAGNPLPIPPLTPPTVFLDVNGNGTVTPLDALFVINFLNTASGEGESTADLSSSQEEQAEGEFFAQSLVSSDILSSSLLSASANKMLDSALTSEEIGGSTILSPLSLRMKPAEFSFTLKPQSEESSDFLDILASEMSSPLATSLVQETSEADSPSAELEDLLSDIVEDIDQAHRLDSAHDEAFSDFGF